MIKILSVWIIIFSEFFRNCSHRSIIISTQLSSPRKYSLRLEECFIAHSDCWLKQWWRLLYNNQKSWRTSSVAIGSPPTEWNVLLKCYYSIFKLLLWKRIKPLRCTWNKLKDLTKSIFSGIIQYTVLTRTQIAFSLSHSDVWTSVWLRSVRGRRNHLYFVGVLFTFIMLLYHIIFRLSTNFGKVKKIFYIQQGNYYGIVFT